MRLRFRHLLMPILVTLSSIQVLQGQTLMIAAAANLKTAMDVLGPAFEAKHPEIKLPEQAVITAAAGFCQGGASVGINVTVPEGNLSDYIQAPESQGQ